MSEGRIYSQRLGAITEAQFHAVASRLNLGRFLHAEPTAGGLFGQNVFMTTTEGEFVLRGAPHYVNGVRNDPWQFTKEKFFADRLHERTHAPVPWPMLHDEASDIFGWPYLLMPRMPGICFRDRSILKLLGDDERRHVALALAKGLAEMRELSWEFAGDFDPTVTLRPYPHGYTQHLIDETKACAITARANNAFTPDDELWIEAAAQRALAAEPAAQQHVYVHGDYKLDNLTVASMGPEWTLRGVFDLHTSAFGDAASDVVRQTCSYLDTDAAQAQPFLQGYLRISGNDGCVAERMPLYVANERIKIWEYFTRPHSTGTWTKGKTFRGWATRYLDEIDVLL